MSVHPFVDAISSALAGVVPEEPVEVDGDWSSSKRRTYKEESQLGSGEGPYVEVVDHRWHGVIRGTKPLVGIGFQSNWNGLSIGDLSERIRVSMPLGQEGSLSRQQVSDVIAAILAAGEYPAGSAELTNQPDVLKTIQITPRK